MKDKTISKFHMCFLLTEMSNDSKFIPDKTLKNTHGKKRE